MNEDLQSRIEELEKEIAWYVIQHKKHQDQVAELTAELETYRPTKLKGNGQCKCYDCQTINWTVFCSRYKGHIYCNDCIKEIFKEPTNEL